MDAFVNHSYHRFLAAYFFGTGAWVYNNMVYIIFIFEN